MLNGTTITSTAVKKYYSIAGMTVAMSDNGGMKYLLTDQPGSVVAITLRFAQGRLIIPEA